MIADPLSANGFVLLGAGKPIVLVAVEWCEICNDAYERWREALAKAAGTDKQRVLITATHVHDAPIADLAAQRLLNKAKAQGSICDLEFHEHGVTVVVDPFSAPYLQGAEVDYVDSIQAAGFAINNPNAVASCGCGHSFQVAEGEEAPDASAGCGSGCSH